MLILLVSGNITDDSSFIGIDVVGIEGSIVGNVERDKRGIPSSILLTEGGPSRRSRRGIVYLSNFLSTYRNTGLSVAYLSSQGFYGSSKVLLTLNNIVVVLDEEEGPG